MQIRSKSSSEQRIFEDLKSAIEKMEIPQHKLTAQCMVVLLSALGIGTDVDHCVAKTKV